MSADTKSRKRKSGDDIVPSAKKAKTATKAKPEERPAPLKSALKKSKVETVVGDEPEIKKTKTTTEVVEELPAEKLEKPKGKKSKATKVVKEPSPEDVEPEASDNEDLNADRTAELLAGFSSDSEGEEEEDGIAISKLPAAPTKGEVAKSIKKAAAALEADSESTPGVVYISRIPHGFYEPQMRAYFSQFGTITHLRLARNRKTGKPQHYAFVEFASAAVADIVSKTMDKYLLFGHILQCRRVPQEQIKEGLWKGGKNKGGKAKPRNRIEGSRLRKGTDRKVWEARVEKEEKKRAEKAEKLKELGYDFEMPAMKGVNQVPIQQKVIEDVETQAGAPDEEAEGEVKLLEGKKAEIVPGVEEKIEKIVEVEDGEQKVTEAKTIKRKNKAKTAEMTVKKRKTRSSV